MKNELYLQKVIELLRTQLEWEIPKDKEMYGHVAKVIEANDISDTTPEEFVAHYRMKFKPGYPDHPTGGVFVDGHYGSEGDIFMILPTNLTPKDSK